MNWLGLDLHEKIGYGTTLRCFRVILQIPILGENLTLKKIRHHQVPNNKVVVGSRLSIFSHIYFHQVDKVVIVAYTTTCR